MFHVEHLRRAVEYTGHVLTPEQLDRFERFHGWLITEAVSAGGIGPAEVDRVETRHLADSVLFASQFGGGGSIWDLGSGVGLPGIPLAILLPDSEVTLVDRSGRRVDLMRRALRILDLENCQVEHTDIQRLRGEVDVIVSRAGLPPGPLREVVLRHLHPAGVAVAAGSWRERPEHPGWTTIEISRDVLDHTVWLLMIRRQ